MTLHTPARRWFNIWNLTAFRPRSGVAFSRRHLLILAIVIYPTLLILVYLTEVGQITTVRQETKVLHARHMRLVQENAYLVGLLGDRLNVERVAQAAETLPSTVAVMSTDQMNMATRGRLDEPLPGKNHSVDVHDWWQALHLERMSAMARR